MKAEDIKKVVVVGAGTMGEGIAHNFAQAGLSVRVVDQDKQVLDRCLAQIDANLKLFLEFGLLTEEPDSIKSRIEPFLSQHLADATRDCDFVVEAIPEILQLKRDLFAQLDSCRRDIILSSNTSSFTISAIAEGLRTPGRVVGLHSFNPAHIIPLVEIHRGQSTADEVVKVTKELMLRVDKQPILVRKEVPGFIVNRIQAAMGREIYHLLNEGIVTPEDLDTAVKSSYGFRLSCLGPTEASDMIGLDTALRASEQLLKAISNATEPSPILVDKVRRGELGIKSGRGWHDYTGRSRMQIIEERNRRLLEQLVLFKQRQHKNTE